MTKDKELRGYIAYYYFDFSVKEDTFKKFIFSNLPKILGFQFSVNSGKRTAGFKFVFSI